MLLSDIQVRSADISLVEQCKIKFAFMFEMLKSTRKSKIIPSEEQLKEMVQARNIEATQAELDLMFKLVSDYASNTIQIDVGHLSKLFVENQSSNKQELQPIKQNLLNAINQKEPDFDRERDQLRTLLLDFWKMRQNHILKCSKSEFLQYKINFILRWVLTNALVAFLFVSLQKYPLTKTIFILFIAGWGLFFVLVRCIGATLYYVKYYLWDKRCLIFNCCRTINNIARVNRAAYQRQAGLIRSEWATFLKAAEHYCTLKQQHAH